jgi:hypothetical protein
MTLMPPDHFFASNMHQTDKALSNFNIQGRHRDFIIFTVRPGLPGQALSHSSPQP